jgi:hypothetical protein
MSKVVSIRALRVSLLTSAAPISVTMAIVQVSTRPPRTTTLLVGRDRAGQPGVGMAVDESATATEDFAVRRCRCRLRRPLQPSQPSTQPQYENILLIYNYSMYIAHRRLHFLNNEGTCECELV